MGLLTRGAVIGYSDNGEAVTRDDVFGGSFRSGQRTAERGPHGEEALLRRLKS